MLTFACSVGTTPDKTDCAWWIVRIVESFAAGACRASAALGGVERAGEELQYVRPGFARSSRVGLRRSSKVDRFGAPGGVSIVMGGREGNA